MYQLMIRAFGAPAPALFKFETFKEAQDVANKAMRDGYYRTSSMVLILGTGSVLNIVSDQAMSEQVRAEAEANRTGGLVQQGRFEVKTEDFVLNVQMGQVPMPPLLFKTATEREAVLDAAIKNKRIEYTFQKDHDIFYVMLGSGMMLISLSGESYLAKRREAIEMHQRALAQQAEAAGPKIDLPFGLGKR